MVFLFWFLMILNPVLVILMLFELRSIRVVLKEILLRLTGQ